MVNEWITVDTDTLEAYGVAAVVTMDCNKNLLPK
jgi:hypothetical protein